MNILVLFAHFIGLIWFTLKEHYIVMLNQGFISMINGLSLKFFGLQVGGML